MCAGLFVNLLVNNFEFYIIFVGVNYREIWAPKNPYTNS